MSPRRPAVSGLKFSTWRRANARRAVQHYKKRGSPSSGTRNSASLTRLRERAMRTLANLENYNKAILARNISRINKMRKEIANYEARRRHKLVRQPSGSYSLALRN